MKRRAGVGLLVAALLAAGQAAAYEAATTHAGLTERAVLASHLGRVLTEVFGLPLGVYEPLKLPFAGAWGERLGDALAKLDAAQGYAPASGRQGRLPAIEWLIAGSVVEEVPAARAANHFFDPATQHGLRQGDFVEGADLRLAQLRAGTASARQVMTGAAFSGRGESSIAWLTSALNDRGLTCFLDSRERAVSAPTREARGAALAQALLCAGAVLHLVEDAGEPALVRGDYRVEFGERGGPYRRYVAEHLGRLGVPPISDSPITVRHLADLMSNSDGGGLADQTAIRFFSSGTLPDSPRGKTRAPSASAAAQAAGYAGGVGVPHLARWQRNAAGEISWSLDEQCYADYAAVLIPEAALAALSALEFLFRGELQLRDGSVVAGLLGLGPGRLAIFAEDGGGARQLLVEQTVDAAGAGATLLEAPTPPAGQRLIALFRGLDENREPIVVSVEGAAP